MQSYDPTRPTLCVLETCLIFELLPLLIISIAASLSSKTNSKDPMLNCRAFGLVVRSQCFQIFHELRPCIVSALVERALRCPQLSGVTLH